MAGPADRPGLVILSLYRAAVAQPAVIRIAEKFAAVGDHWNPRIVAELNGQHVKIVKFAGRFAWHHHVEEDELLLVVRGRLRMGVRDEAGERWLEVGPGEMIVIPRGLDHCPESMPLEEEAHVLLFEPVSTVNTGNAVSDARTRFEVDRL